jgi:hypothetical protein
LTGRYVRFYNTVAWGRVSGFDVTKHQFEFTT